MNSLSCFLEKTLPYLHTTFPFIIERNSHNQKKHHLLTILKINNAF